MRALRRTVVLAVMASVLSSVTLALAATPEKVLNDPGVSEGSSAASDGYLVWSANSEARPGRFNSYVMADGEKPVRVNRVGTHSNYISIDGTTVVFQEDEGSNDDLWFYDAESAERSAVPAGVNTPGIEFRPTLSGDWLLYSRNNFNRVRFRDAWVKVILVQVSTGERTVLRTEPARTNYLVSDQVKGDWATYERCRFRSARGFFDCDVFRYQISTGDVERLPNPGLQQYAGALSDDGTVYLVRTRNRHHWNCGSKTRIVRMPVAGPSTVIATLPDGKDSLTTFALDETDGSTTLYLDEVRCSRNSTGIYRIVDADTAT